MKISGGWSPDGDRVDFEVEAELRPYEERDLFAAFALAGLLARPVIEEEVGPDAEDFNAQNAYYYADKMIAARDKK